MNWSRGFFRLWIAIAFLWIGATTIILLQEWRERWHQDPIVFAPAAKEESGPLAQPESAEGGWDNKSFPVVWPRNAEPNPYTQSAQADKANRRAQVAERRRRLIETYIYAGLLPPLVLLAVGLVIRWIIGGFRGT